MNILDKALSGGLAAVIVYAIYWLIQTLIRRNGFTRRGPNSKESAQEQSISKKASKNESNPDLPNLSDIKVRFNYWYAFKYIPHVIDLYCKGEISVEAIINFSYIVQKHPEFSKIAVKTKFAFSIISENFKVLSVSIPNTGKISEVEIGYIVFNETDHKAVYFTLEQSINNYVIASPEKDGVYKILNTVDTPQEFVEYVLPLAFSVLKENEYSKDLSSHDKDSIKVSNVLQGEDKITIKSCTPLLEFRKRFLRIKVADYADTETNKNRKVVLCIDKNGEVTQLYFSTSIGELNSDHIVQQKEDLQVVELSSGKLLLTRKGHIKDNLLYNLEYVNKCIEIIKTEASKFLKQYSCPLPFPSYTYQELLLFISASILGTENVSKIRTQKGNLFIEKLFSEFVGDKSLREVIDAMQGMSFPCLFADAMHITSPLSNMLDNCKSVAFEDKRWNGEQIRMLNLFQSMNFFTLVHLAPELRNITLSEIFERKDELFVNERCERTLPSICTSMDEWPILETIDRAKEGYIKFIQEFLIDRIEWYRKLYEELSSKVNYLKLAKDLIIEPYNVESDLVFQEYNYEEIGENPPLSDSELSYFMQTIEDLISRIKSFSTN